MLTPEQIAMRMHGIGSSEIAAIAGEHPYNNAHRVWLLKRGLVVPDPPNDATWLGSEMEPIIAKRYQQEMGVELVPGPGTVAHPEHSWCMATTDYEWADGSRIVEAKWVGMRPMAHWTMDADGAPPHVFLQMTWQMLVRRAQRLANGLPPIDRADAVVIFGATAEFRIYEFTYDPDVGQALLAIGARFWRCVHDGSPPPVDGSSDSTNVLRTLYPEARRQLVTAPDGAEALVTAYAEADAASSEWQQKKALAGNRLREMIGDAAGIEGPWGSVTWKADKNGRRTLRCYVKKTRRV